MRHLYILKKLISVALTAALICCMTGCSGKKTLPVKTEEVHITIPGMSGEKKLIFLSDLHIVTQSDEVTDTDAVRGRLSWSSYEGVTAAEQWPGWVTYINKTEADLVVFGADMLDFNSHSNLDTLKAHSNRMDTPILLPCTKDSLLYAATAFSISGWGKDSFNVDVTGFIIHKK